MKSRLHQLFVPKVTCKSISLFLILLLPTLLFASEQKALAIDTATHSLVASEGQYYQWYHNGEKVSGANEQSLHVTESGNYAVEVVDEVGEVTRQEATVAVTAMGAIIKIILIGDSTVAIAPTNLYPNMGWGQVFQYYFNSANIQVMDFAHSGTSTTTFYSGYWPAAKKAIAAGDYVFMQFGHNDQKIELPTQYAAPFGKYQEYLTKYANEVKALGAIPVFVTSVNRNIWVGGKLDSTSLGQYPTAVRQLGARLNVPVVDLHDKSATLYMALGEAYLSNYVFNNYQAGEYPNYPNGNADKTHFDEMGAIEISRLVIQCIKELAIKNADLKALVPFLNPLYEVAVTANPKASATMITRTASYAKGMHITLETTPKTAGTFVKWNDQASKSVATTTHYSFTMGDVPTSYTALYKGAIVSGLEETTLADHVSVYPNPFSQTLTIRTNGAFEYALYDMTGSLLESGKGQEAATLGSELPTGLYLVKVYKEGVVIHLKVTKN